MADNFISDPNATLVDLGGKRSGVSLQNDSEDIHIWGAPGSGKASTSGQTIARSFLRAGMGGLVLCSKASEVERWQKYAEENGRESSLCIFDGEQALAEILKEAIAADRSRDTPEPGGGMER
jgi:hypothetical protein